MKKLITIALLFFSVGIFAQTYKYDSLQHRTNYFTYRGHFIGYEKNNKCYDKDNNEMRFDTFMNLFNSNDDGSPVLSPSLIVDLPKVIQPEPVPIYQPIIKSAVWNTIFNRWDYIYW